MRFRSAVLTLTCALAVSWTAGAVIPDQVPDLPVLGPETTPGHLSVAPAAPVTPTAKTVDGDVSDWVGSPTRIAGSAIYSAGEYVYSDYIGDDFGADDGTDAERLATLDPLRELEPRTYRLDPLEQAAGDEFDVPPPVGAELAYGDVAYPAELDHHADIAEVRIAAGEDQLFFLVRTAQMTVDPGTAVLILLDTEDGGSYPAPGGITTGAEVAILVSGDQIIRYTELGVSLPLPPGVCDDGGCLSAWEAATNADGFVNAVEVMIRPSRFGLAGLSQLGVGVAAGVVNADATDLADVSTGEPTVDLINVAFRDDEPVRIRMDKQQALALHDGNIDRYLAEIDLENLAVGATESFSYGPGYYERIFLSDSPVARETYSSDESQGVYQHYGLYVPTSYVHGMPSPGLLWLHPRSSGTTHLAGAWVPGIIRQLGERSGRVVFSPSARGSSTWYVGRGHESFLETWDDAMASYLIDPDRVAVAGHSMGGFGSYLVGLLYPDRFAAAFPIAGATTQGGWLGVGDPQPSTAQNGGDVEAELMFNIIENARNLPYVIFQGTEDELVWVTGVTRMALRFTELGYRNRLYLLLGQEHFSPLIVDEWADAARYLDSFERDPDPARVTYRVWPALERQVETVGTPEGATLDYAFDGAYWVDGLSIRDGDPTVPETTGTFDGTTFGRGLPSYLTIPEASAAAVGHTAPFLMTGLAWLGTGAVEARNAFEVTLTNIATALLDVERMGLSTGDPIEATVTTDGPAVLRLAGVWDATPTVTGAAASYSGSVLEITIASPGTHAITIAP